MTSPAGSSAPRVSVLLPFRDAAETLREAVESVLAQEGPSFEVIAVDDGSRDEGPRYLEALAAREPRVRLLRTDGVGVALALERARAAARAPLLARMDADDVCLPGRFAAQVSLLEAQPRLAVAGTQVEPFAEGAVGEGLRLYVEWQNALLTAEDHRRERFVESPLCHPSILAKADAVEAVGGYAHGDFPEDYDLFLRLAAAGFELAKVPAVLLRWRHREARLTFADPRMAPERIRALKARHLAPLLHADPRPLVVWGAGPTGRRMARALEAHGVRVQRFVDIDPLKIGRTRRRAPVVGPEGLHPTDALVLVAVGTRGARALVRERLDAEGFREGADYLCVA